MTSDLPSAVWPAGLVPHACVSRLLPDRRPAECGLAGRVGSACVCVSRLLPDRRPAECGLAGRVGSACVCVSRLLPDRRPASYVDIACSTCSFPIPFIFGIKLKIGKEMKT